MITEDYCSVKVTGLLEEKGFIVKYYYVQNEYRCPTHQMAMKWLREKHNAFIEICADKALNFKDIIFRPAIYDKNLCCLWESDNYPTYEEAVEAALIYALKKLM